MCPWLSNPVRHARRRSPTSTLPKLARNTWRRIAVAPVRRTGQVTCNSVFSEKNQLASVHCKGVNVYLGMQEVSQRKLQNSECLKNRQRDATHADTPLEKNMLQKRCSKPATATHTKAPSTFEHEAHRFPGNVHAFVSESAVFLSGSRSGCRRLSVSWAQRLWRYSSQFRPPSWRPCNAKVIRTDTKPCRTTHRLFVGPATMRMVTNTRRWSCCPALRAWCRSPS